jgi:hypothetical protein
LNFVNSSSSWYAGTLFAEVVPESMWYTDGSSLTIPLNKKKPKEHWGLLIMRQRLEDNKDSIDACSLNYLGRHYAGKSFLGF